MSSFRSMKLHLLMGTSTTLAIALTATAANAAAPGTVAVSGAIQSTVDGALVSDQSNSSNAASTSSTATVSTSLDTVVTSSANVDSNKTGASTTGNVDTLVFSDTGSANTATNAAAAARQSNTGNQTATASGTTIELTAGNTAQSSLSVKNNADTAAVSGNTVAQSLTLDSTNLSLGDGNASGGASAASTSAELTGNAMVTSVQANSGATVSATDSGSKVSLSAASAQDSSLTVTGNTQAATANGSSAANGIALSGVNIGTGVVVESVQSNTATNVTASTAGATALTVGSTADNSSLVLSSNRLQSQATGVTSANSLSVAGTDVVLPSAASTLASKINITGGSGLVQAGYAVQNSQSVDGDITATTAPVATVAYANQVSGAVTDSTVATDSNAILAKAQGAVTANTASLNLGASLSTGVNFNTVAEGVAIASQQTVTNGSDVMATIATGSNNLVSSPLITTGLSGSLSNSSVSSSNNLVQANAEAANASNVLTASATSLSTAGSPSDTAKTLASTTGVTADAAFAIANAQSSGDGKVSATIGDAGVVQTTIAGEVNNASVAANGNQFAGFAVADKAANTLAVSGTNVSTDTALVNAQSSGADVSATLGEAQPVGVTTSIGSEIRNSSVAVNGNSAVGSSVNNSAANTLAVSATSLSGTGPNNRAQIFPGTTDADNSLTNLQTLVSGSTSDTTVNGTFGIVQVNGPALADSKLSVSNNSQFAESLGNSATNKLSSTATDVGAGIAPTAALSSTQNATTDITSGSSMTGYANVASSGSSIAINGNSNTALGVVNNGSNTLTVSGTDIANRAADRSYATVGQLEGDYALGSVQTANGSVSSIARTNLYNTEGPAPTNSAMGLSNGSVALNGNATTAEGSGNRVANQLAVAATATNGGSAVLGNSQDNAASVDSSATTFVSYALAPSTYNANSAINSQVSVDGNSTTALARGNTANNTLNYSAGAQYTGSQTPATVTSGSGGSNIAAVDLSNTQNNSGPVNASSTNATYSMVLNGDTAGSSAAMNSSASVSGNATTALAYGNSAVNSLTMTTFGQGVPSSAVSSTQTNGGAVSATATTVNYGASFVGATNNSAIRNTGNSVTAQAVGNSSVSTIGG